MTLTLTLTRGWPRRTSSTTARYCSLPRLARPRPPREAGSLLPRAACPPPCILDLCTLAPLPSPGAPWSYTLALCTLAPPAARSRLSSLGELVSSAMEMARRAGGDGKGGDGKGGGGAGAVS